MKVPEGVREWALIFAAFLIASMAVATFIWLVRSWLDLYAWLASHA